jgi:FHS family L-fucose permease-like MFS transporter
VSLTVRKGYFINYVSAVRPGTTHATGANLLAVAQGCFAIGRFIASGLLKVTKPRLVLIGFLSGVVLFACLTMGLKGNACVFPLIFALSIRGLGRHSKRGASFIVAAVSGGALFPPVLGTVADHIGTQKAFFIPLIGFVIAWMFPLYLNLFKAKSLDGWTEEKAPTVTEKDVESMHEDEDEKKGAAIEHQEIRA